MREKERIKRILELLQTHWEKHQDLRFGQLLINLGVCDDNIRFWRNDDEDLEKYLKTLKF